MKNWIKKTYEIQMLVGLSIILIITLSGMFSGRITEGNLTLTIPDLDLSMQKVALSTTEIICPVCGKQAMLYSQDLNVILEAALQAFQVGAGCSGSTILNSVSNSSLSTTANWIHCNFCGYNKISFSPLKAHFVYNPDKGIIELIPVEKM